MLDDWITLNENHDPLIKRKFNSLHEANPLADRKSRQTLGIENYSRTKYKLPKLRMGRQYQKGSPSKNVHLHRLSFTQKEECFSYLLHFQQILEQNILSDSEEKQKITKDLILIHKDITNSQNVHEISLKVQQFKKNSHYFHFKLEHSRILFYILLTQTAICLTNIEKAIEELHFCEYHARKLKLDHLTICFLWHIATLQSSLSLFEEAILTIKNLLEMGVITKNHLVIKNGLQKMALIYYYRGNATLCEYYQLKSQKGLDSFECEIYSRQYNRQDEIKRLQHLLFEKNGYLSPVQEYFQNTQAQFNSQGFSNKFYSSNSIFPTISFKIKRHENEKNCSQSSEVQEEMNKRKFNSKYQIDTFYQEQQGYPLKRQKFMDTLALMMKNHSDAKTGNSILKVVKRNKIIGQKSQNKIQMSPSGVIIKSLYINQQISLPGAEIIDNGKQNKTGCLDNQNRMIKSHLSKNRQNNYLNSEAKWKKFLSFLYALIVKYTPISEDTLKHLPSRKHRQTRSILRVGKKSVYKVL